MPAMPGAAVQRGAQRRLALPARHCLAVRGGDGRSGRRLIQAFALVLIILLLNFFAAENTSCNSVNLW